MDKVMPMFAPRHYDGVSEQSNPGVHSDLTKNSAPAGLLIGTEEWNRAQAEIRLLTELVKSERNFGDGIELSEFRSKTGDLVTTSLGAEEPVESQKD
jgi:hypothetical protein